MRKRYDRWVEERKLDALTTVASVLQKLSLAVLDLPYLHLSIMKVYSKGFLCVRVIECTTCCFRFKQ